MKKVGKKAKVRPGLGEKKWKLGLTVINKNPGITFLDKMGGPPTHPPPLRSAARFGIRGHPNLTS